MSLRRQRKEKKLTREELRLTPEGLRLTPGLLKLTPEELRLTLGELRLTPEGLPGTPEGLRLTPEDLRSAREEHFPGREDLPTGPGERSPTRGEGRARPAGVLGAEVWVKLVDADSPAPTDPAALTFLTMTTKPSFRAEFKAGEGGTNF